MAEREIKFRAWNKVMGSMMGIAGIDLQKGICRYWHVNIDVALKSVFLMQFTGLKDKNGKEIYEGDILRRQLDEHMSSIVEVVWAGNGWHYKPAIPYEYGDLTEGYLKYSEVIGNIHENPELLESKVNGR